MSPLTRRATSVYRTADADQHERGRRWYPSAHSIAAQHAETYGLPVETTAGMIAALSPRAPWSRNLVLTERMLASQGTLTAGGITVFLNQARRIHDGADPLDVLKGPKTRAFYRAIITAGESDDPVIDRHAWDMLVGKRHSDAPNLGQYREAADRMRRAADILCQPVSQVQAVTWVTWRDRFWKAGSFDPATE